MLIFLYFLMLNGNKILQRQTIEYLTLLSTKVLLELSKKTNTTLHRSHGALTPLHYQNKSFGHLQFQN